VRAGAGGRARPAPLRAQARRGGSTVIEEGTMHGYHWIAVAALLASAAPAAHASEAEHRRQDAARHAQMAKAHAAAAQCLKGGTAPADCLKALQADCKGAAVGRHCGLRAQPDQYKGPAQHIAEHERMAVIHEAAAACMRSDRPYKDCTAELSRACGGIGVGKSGGRRHAH
jgi:hypothetical protein